MYGYGSNGPAYHDVEVYTLKDDIVIDGKAINSINDLVDALKEQNEKKAQENAKNNIEKLLNGHTINNNSNNSVQKNVLTSKGLSEEDINKYFDVKTERKMYGYGSNGPAYHDVEVYTLKDDIVIDGKAINSINDLVAALKEQE